VNPAGAASSVVTGTRKGSQSRPRGPQRLAGGAPFISPTTAVGTYQFTGGTGRFEDASGTADPRAGPGARGHVDVVFGGTFRY
jgi:hypothetical protein